MSGRRIVFVGHDASLTGAPVSLLRLLRWIRSNTSDQPSVVLLRGGPLEGDYSAVCDTAVVKLAALGEWVKKARMLAPPWDGETVARRAVAAAQQSRVRRLARQADVVVVNTVAASTAVLALENAAVPVVLHVHEMDVAIELHAARLAREAGIPTGELLGRALGRADAIVVPSRMAALDLGRWDQEAAGRAQVIGGLVPEEELAGASGRSRAQARRSLGIAPGEPLVVGSGSVDWRKGPEMFVQLASFVNRVRPVKFLWIGAGEEDRVREMRADVRRCGLEGSVEIVGAAYPPFDYYRAADVFALTSHEEPLGFVALEAAALGTPVVAFRSSGVSELVGADSTLVVDHLDTPAMASAVLAVLSHGGVPPGDPYDPGGNLAGQFSSVNAPELYRVIAGASRRPWLR